jgi:uncharacterized Zn-finger protein
MPYSAILAPSVVLRLNETASMNAGRSARSMSADGVFTDLVFICAGGKRLSAHQAVMCQVSPLLAQLLQTKHDLTHCNTCSFSRPELTVSIPDVGGDSLSALLDLVYVGLATVDSFKLWDELSVLIDLLGMRIVLECIQEEQNENEELFSLAAEAKSFKATANVQSLIDCTTTERENEKPAVKMRNKGPTRKKLAKRHSVSASRIEMVRSSLKKRRASALRTEVCDECGDHVTGDNNALVDHVALQHQSQELKSFVVEENGNRTCLFCSKALSGSKKALLHIARKHHPLTKQKSEANTSQEDLHDASEDCGTFSEKVREFRQKIDSFRWETVAHLGTQTKGDFACPICHKRYESRARIQQHCANHFNNILIDYYELKGVTSCPFCSKVLAGKYSMFQHVGIFHKKILDFVKNKEFENYLFCRS